MNQVAFFIRTNPNEKFENYVSGCAYSIRLGVQFRLYRKNLSDSRSI